MSYDFRSEPLPFTCTDKDGYTCVVVAMMPDGRYVGWYVAKSGNVYAMTWDARDNHLIKPRSEAEEVLDWLREITHSHFLSAVEAFHLAGKKIMGIKFIRTVRPCGLTAAKEAFETVAGGCQVYPRTYPATNAWGL